MNKYLKIYMLALLAGNMTAAFAGSVSDEDPGRDVARNEQTAAVASSDNQNIQGNKGAQLFNEVISQIEENNPSLKALRAQIDAEKVENKTGITMVDPEVEFNYLWGKPTLIGNRKDFGIRQSFDFPTTYFIKGNIADKKNVAAELKYKASKIDLVLNAKMTLIDLTYYNALCATLDKRKDDAKTLFELYSKSFEKGEVSVIEKNKAELNYVNVKSLLSTVEAEREAVLSQLKAMNGGEAVVYNSGSFATEPLPESFEEWYDMCKDRNPVLEYVRQQVEISEKEVKLSKHERLPKLSAGYMSENVVGEKYQGVSLGVSIPLWENKNKTKLAKARLMADRENENSSKIEFYSKLQTLYTKTQSLSKVASDYRSSLENLDNTSLLRKALDAGKISLLEYIQELNLYYDMYDSYLGSERDYSKSMAEMQSF